MKFVKIGALLAALALVLLFTSGMQPTEAPAAKLAMKPAAEDIVPVLEMPGVQPPLWRITAYCACEKCCGQWAAGRQGEVTGAAGTVLVPGVSCASPLPFGTMVHIDGLGVYIVQDRTSSAYAAKHDDRVIDIYFEDHAAALQFGVKNLAVTVDQEV